MKVLVHDYSGHAFAVQLSRQLARQGHEVHHLYSSTFQTPRGVLTRQPADPPGFTIEGVDLDRPFAKYSFVKRAFQEREYGRRLARAIVAHRPQVVLCGNTPLDPLAASWRAARSVGAGFVFWLQDIYGIAIDRILRQRLKLLGAAIGARYIALEKRVARGSDAVVAITEDFAPILAEWGVAPDHVAVIENWAPREDLPPQPRGNAWAAAYGLADKLVYLYSGTLGLKHNPALLLALARRFADRPDVRVVVVSEGLGADWLRQHGRDCANLVILPFQPFARLPEVIATGDVLVAVLEPEAGIFSVPSKILTYLCAGRPLLAAMPAENLAARIITRHGAGLVAGPNDADGFAAAAARLAADADLRAQLGKNGLDYAARTFDIQAVAARFADVLTRAARRQSGASV
ncbi:MAG: glycosyltransferase family 4 protein [Proteobacteria bacterium]|nr:glycosyltransferase family 4 protein [Pseudomonadota bacterium]